MNQHRNDDADEVLRASMTEAVDQAERTRSLKLQDADEALLADARRT